MNSKEERDVKQRQEFKYFVSIVLILLALFFFFVKANSLLTYADEVVLADQPENVGGSNDSEGFIIDITSDGSEQSDGEQTSDIVDASNVTIESDNPDTAVPSESAGTNIIFVDEAHEQRYEEAHGSNDDDDKSNKTGVVTADNGDEIYVPDSDDDCPVSDLVPLPTDVQEYIWNHCKKVTGDYKNYYAFILGAIQLESEFKRTAIHHNSNGSTDRGLMQINSCNIKECKRAGLITCTDDLWDIYKNIDCGFHEMNDYIRKFGVCESAYFAYNTGRTSGGSNKNSRVVMSNMAQWNTRLFG